MDNILAKTANNRLAQVRRVLRKTPADFAALLCISRSHFYGLENGHRAVNDRIIKQVSMTFGVSEQWLRTGEGAMFIEYEEETRRKIVLLFDKLRPDFQEYVLRHIDLLLDLQNNCCEKPDT